MKPPSATWRPSWGWIAFAGLLLWGVGYIVAFGWMISNSRDFIVEERRNALCSVETCPLTSLPMSASFEAASDDTKFLLSGFSRPETAGTWTVEQQAEIFLPVDLGDAGEIEVQLDFDVALSAEQSSQRLRLMDDQSRWREVANLQAPSPPDSIVFTLPAGDRSRPGLHLRLGLPDSWVPAKVGVSADSRRLGIFLKSLRVRDASEPNVEANEFARDEPERERLP